MEGDGRQRIPAHERKAVSADELQHGGRLHGGEVEVGIDGEKGLQ
jgi:hypothetical protein